MPKISNNMVHWRIRLICRCALQQWLWTHETFQYPTMHLTNGRKRKTQSHRNLSLTGKICCLRYSHSHRYNTRINKIIFGYLSKGSAAESIARENLFLPRDWGCIGILVPLIQGLALKINYLIQLGKKDNNNIWTLKIRNFTPHWQLLRSNVIPKNYNSYVPDCYSDKYPS